MARIQKMMFLFLLLATARIQAAPQDRKIACEREFMICSSNFPQMSEDGLNDATDPFEQMCRNIQDVMSCVSNVMFTSGCPLPDLHFHRTMRFCENFFHFQPYQPDYVDELYTPANSDEPFTQANIDEVYTPANFDQSVTDAPRHAAEDTAFPMQDSGFQTDAPASVDQGLTTKAPAAEDNAHAAGAASAACPGGWATLGRQCYFFSQSITTWFSAERKCKRMGAKLVYMKTEEEAHFVKSTAERERRSFWLGLTDTQTEGRWLWADGSELGEPAYWARLHGDVEPNNANGNEHCAELRHYDLMWNDLPCGHRSYFACQARAGDIVGQPSDNPFDNWKSNPYRYDPQTYEL